MPARLPSAVILTAICSSLLALAGVTPVLAVEQTVTIAAPGSPEGVGFNEDRNGLAWQDPGDTKELHLRIQGGGSNIINSQVVDPDGPLWNPPGDNGSCTSEKLWKTAPFLPKEQYRARFEGGFCGTKGSSATWEAAVIMADLDTDANNNSNAVQRPPAAGGDEADKEQVAKRGSDLTKPGPGLLIGVNRCYEEDGRDYDADQFREPGIDRKKYPREDNEKDGIFTIKTDPDQIEGLLTLKLPITVPAKAKITYDKTRIRVYAVRGADFALIPSDGLFRVDTTGGMSLTAATPQSRDGTFLTFGPTNLLKLEAIKTSPQLGTDDVVVTLIPDKGKESHNRMAFTATEINSHKKKGDPASAIKWGKVAYPSKAIKDKLATKSIKDTLKEELPKYAWFAYVEDVSNTDSEAAITITSFDKNDVQIDTLSVNGTGKIKQLASGGKKYASDEIWFVPKDSKVTPTLDDNLNTIMVEPSGTVLIEYTTPNTTAKARKRILIPPPEKFMVVAYSGFGAFEFSDNKSAAWDVAEVSLNGSGGATYLNQWYSSFGGPFGKVPGVEKIIKPGHLIFHRIAARNAVREWMKEDITQGGKECRNVFITSISWGATNATDTAQWFEETYDFMPRMQVMVEGVHRFGGPYGDIGPAFVCKNYYASEPHWPRGQALGKAENFSFDLTKTTVSEVPVSSTTPVSSRPVVTSGRGSLAQVWEEVVISGRRKVLRTSNVVSNFLAYIDERSVGGHPHICAEWSGGIKMHGDFVSECPKETSDH